MVIEGRKDTPLSINIQGENIEQVKQLKIEVKILGHLKCLRKEGGFSEHRPGQHFASVRHCF